MLSEFATRNLDDLKLLVVGLLGAIRNGGQVKFTLASDTTDDVFRVLDVLTEGGQVQLTFTPPSHRATLENMKKRLKLFERGIISTEELTNSLVHCSHQILKVMEEYPEEQRWPLATEIHRVLSLLDTDDCCPAPSSEKDEAGLRLPLLYTGERYRCFVILMEALVCRYEKEDVAPQRNQLAELLASATSSDGLYVTDAFNGELLFEEIEAIVNRGGTIRISTLSSTDAKALAAISRLVDDWYGNRLRIRTFCRRLKSCINKLNVANSEWWDRLYGALGELWIVAFGKYPRRTRLSIAERATQEETRCLIDEIEKVIHAPLRRLVANKPSHFATCRQGNR